MRSVVLIVIEAVAWRCERAFAAVVNWAYTKRTVARAVKEMQ